MNPITNWVQVLQLFVPLSNTVPQTNAKQIGLSQGKSPNGGNRVPDCTHRGDLPYFQITWICRDT